MSEATASTGRENGQWRPSPWVIILLALFGICSVGSLVLHGFITRAQSMEPTLLVGEHLLAKKLIFEGRGCNWYQRALPYECIHRGDLIIFKLPVQDHPLYVKRVIGMPGDRIKIVNQSVYVNGQLQAEPYAVHDPAFYDPYGDNFPPASADSLPPGVSPEWAEQILKYVQNGELAVPVDDYFVLGDNREHSWDSRYWGFVDHKAIFGRPVAIYLSATSAGVRWGRIFHTIH